MAHQQGYGQQQPYQPQAYQQGYPQQPQYGPQQQQQDPYGHQQQQPQYGHHQQSQHGQSAPQQQHPNHPAQTSTGQSDSGIFQGGSYSITHRDTNAVLNIDLQQGASVRSTSGAMIHMSSTIELSGKIKFSMKKFFTGGEMSESTYAGHGKVALGPTLFGDIITVKLDGREQWTIGKDAYLACTNGVSKDIKAQGLGKAMFSGENLFIYRVGGEGLLWLTSFGAVDRLDLQPGEQHIVDNGHLIAWSCDYKIEKAGGGAMSSMKTGEGLVCHFTGPGTVYVQTRNSSEFESYIRSIAGSGN